MKCPVCKKEVDSLRSVQKPGGTESPAICSKCFKERVTAKLKELAKEARRVKR